MEVGTSMARVGIEGAVDLIYHRFYSSKVNQSCLLLLQKQGSQDTGREESCQGIEPRKKQGEDCQRLSGEG